MSKDRILWSRMSIILVVVVVICGLAYFGRNILSAQLQRAFWNEDPAAAAAMGHEMLNYTLPVGFRERKSMDIQGLRTVIITHDSEPIMIVLGQPPINIDDPEWSDEILESWARKIDNRTYNTKVVTTQEVQIDGKRTTLTVREGPDETGQQVRQLTGIISGKQGSMILVISGKQEDWTQALVDQFIASIQGEG